LTKPKETPPPGTAPKPFQLPPADDFVLPNGLRVTIVPYGVMPKVAVRAFINAGGICESASNVWISKLTALLMKEGTIARSAEEVAGAAAALGGQVDLGAGSEFTVAGGLVLSEFGPDFVEVLADVIRHPALPLSELARLKTDLGRELAVDRVRPRSLARERLLRTLYPDHPFGRTYPDEAALAAYTLGDVRAFYDRNFSAAGTHVYVAGKIDPKLKQSIMEAFGDWERGEAELREPPVGVAQRSLQLIDRPGAQQSSLLLGLPVADPTSSDFIALEAMHSMLGGSFASRIVTNIREHKGYTYSPFSSIGTRRHLARWTFGADVSTAVTGASLKEIFYEIDLIRKEPPSVQELRGIQDYLAGFFILQNTVSPDAVISQLQFTDSQGLDRSFLSSYVARIMALTPQDIQRVAVQYIVPSKMTVVVAGDGAQIEEQLKGVI